MESFTLQHSKKEMVNYLKSHHLKTSFLKKQDILDYLKEIQWSFDFPWRQDQHDIINGFMNLNKSNKKFLCAAGLFGSGKTSTLLGMLNMGFWKKMFSFDQVCFVAFNVCIKEEIRKKIGKWSCKDKVNVRTFDSLIYEFCAFYDFPNLKLPNYKGRRLFIYKKLMSNDDEQPFEKYNHIKYLFVDECQDLEKQAFQVFRKYFPNACIIFVGDIFQSVQKEPRESLLYYISQTIVNDVHYFYMKNTPRVPKSILREIQGALTQSYPEYTNQIMEWYSSNHETDSKVEWITFESYKKVYEEMFRFIETFPQEKSMILTFSSCITVKGSLGDLARVRRIIKDKGIDVNMNYKNMDSKKLFLSTANSSKGLERDYVFVMSTFPLEKAFINFSQDLTTNLITVALSRAKKKVLVCVPTNSIKFSSAFHAYPTCPKPILSKDIQLPEPQTFQDFMNLEHNVTELLRQNIIQFETKILFKSFVKKTMDQKIYENEAPQPIPKSCLTSEEERCFVGVLIEVLMTSLWTNQYPTTPSLHEIEKNPYYLHCITKIKNLINIYSRFINIYRTSLSNTFDFFKTIFLYTEIHIAINHKMFFYFKDVQKQELFRYWLGYRHYVYQLQPCTTKPFKPQTNVKMPLLTGIADAVLNDTQKHIYEIKASVKQDWKDDAFIQAFCYAIMLGQSWFQIKLINLFKNSHINYIIFIGKVKKEDEKERNENVDNVRKLRQLLTFDIMLWNFSAYMAKKGKFTNKNIECFVNVEWNDLKNEIDEILVIRILSPTRFHIDFHSFHVTNLNEVWQNYLLDTKDDFVYCGLPNIKDKWKPLENIPNIQEKYSHITIQQDVNDIKTTNILYKTCELISQVINGSVI